MVGSGVSLSEVDSEVAWEVSGLVEVARVVRVEVVGSTGHQSEVACPDELRELVLEEQGVDLAELVGRVGALDEVSDADPEVKVSVE